jgi:hypothetical protein
MRTEKRTPFIKDLGGQIYNVRRLIDPNVKEWSATNLCVAHNAKTGYIGMLRSGNYVITESGAYEVIQEGTIKSRIYIGEFDVKTMKFKDLRLVDVSKIVDGTIKRGLEDPKLFYRDNAWHFTCVTMEKKHTTRARMAICRLNDDLTEIVSFKKFPGIDFHRPEKNWMLPDKPNPNFDWIYASNATVKDDVLITQMADNEEIAALRGNTNLLDLGDGTYLAVVHRLLTRQIMNNTHRFYDHYFAQYDNQGKIIALSNPFKFEIDGVEFAAGLTTRGDDFLISYGSKDVSCHVATIAKAVVLKGLKKIKY